jgi:enoyl-CoA hydratase/carnithine racemase
MPDLRYEKSGHVAKLTLNRPERMNAISVEMLGRFGEALVDADDDPEIRVILITGSGRGFCSGLDLKDAAAGTGIGGAGVLSPDGGASHLSTRDDTPVLCAINGPAAGYGVDLALGCDIRLIGDRARLLPGFARRGIVPESGGTWYLPRLIGWAKACEVAFLAEDISPERALELGLVNQVVPQDELMAEAERWAEKIAANAPLALVAMKRLFRHGLTEDFESHTHHVLMQLLLLFRSQDFKEGIQSFLERREPRFRGH